MNLLTIQFYKKSNCQLTSDGIFNRYYEESVICRLSGRNGWLCGTVTEQVHHKVVQQFQYGPLEQSITMWSIMCCNATVHCIECHWDVVYSDTELVYNNWTD